MKVLVTEPIHEKGLEVLRSTAAISGPCGVERDAVMAAIADCDAVLVRTAVISASVMDAAPALKCIAKHGIGVDNIDVAAATARGIRVVNAPLSNLNAVAEHTLALMLAAMKALAVQDQAVRGGRYAAIRNGLKLAELTGKTVGLIGLGRIARRVAELLGPFRVRLLACDPFAAPDAFPASGATSVELDALLREADVVSVHVPLTESTRNLIGGEQLALMKPEAFLINAARGGIVDEAALAAALQAGKLAGAATDVFAREPPDPDNPLCACDTAILTPHAAALTAEALESMATQSATGVVEVLRGRKPTFPVNSL